MMKKNNITKIFIIVFIMIIINSCRVDLGYAWLNQSNHSYDVNEELPFSSGKDTVSVDFSLFSTTNTIIPKENIPDSIFKFVFNEGMEEGFYYTFSVLNPIIPIIKIHSISITDSKGDTIPSVIFYLNIEREMEFIEPPYVFLNKSMMRNNMFEVYLVTLRESSNYKKININYDIEVGEKRYNKVCKYKRTFYSDWRPKFW